MPTYEYACERCEHRFEQFQPITAAPLRKCPACGQRTLHRLLGTGGGIIFRGSGFYQTDYRSESYKKAEQAEKAAGGGNGHAKAGDGPGGNGQSDKGKKDTPPASGKSKTPAPAKSS
ncbi:MAG: zinc ribbon domain-containing protein [Planctomycetota bacterium]